MNKLQEPDQVQVKGRLAARYEDFLSSEALNFISTLHRKFNPRREELLQLRAKRQIELDQGRLPHFPSQTQSIRQVDWQVAPIPDDLQDRRVEITGPVNRKMVINALNSGANVFMADFEDANAPSWDNCMEGQMNLYDAIRNQIDFKDTNQKTYSLNQEHAVLVVRPRGWHLTEKNLWIDEAPISASLFDFGLYFFHNAQTLLNKGSGPYFYLPKLENHLEARLWNDVFIMAQELLEIPQASIKATVLLETILASFEIEEILYELRKHIAGMNAGRWDYIFSVIKKFKNHPDFILPDRSQVTMKVPFMKAYAEMLVKICHKRGAHAIGGMSAFIPSKDEAINKMAFAKVQEDKRNEASQGYDGTWVAHPFLVPLAREEFDKVLQGRPHQKEVKRDDLKIQSDDLLNVTIPGGKISQEGVRLNINVGILYLESWLQGVGAAAIYNLMEDAATAEISRAQVWQWMKNQVQLSEGAILTPDLYDQLVAEEIIKIKALLGPERVATSKLDQAINLFNRLVKDDQFDEFLTLQAYNLI